MALCRNSNCNTPLSNNTPFTIPLVLLNQLAVICENGSEHSSKIQSQEHRLEILLHCVS